LPDVASDGFSAREGVVGGLAQLARAPALQAGGHRFESDILHGRAATSDKLQAAS
jgi:hypothetical protein